VIDNVSIGIMTVLNTLMQRHGIKPSEVVATLERTDEAGNFRLHFCPPEKAHLGEQFDQLLTALDIPEDSSNLDGPGEALYSKLEIALERAPRRRLPPGR
jgi:hypothetical protein